MITNNDFVMVEFNKIDIEAATNTAADMAKSGLKYFGGESGLVVGCLGEMAFKKLYPESTRHNVSQFDFLLDGVKTEIKSHICNTKPNITWEVAPKKSYQQPDYFVFCFIHSSFEYGWVAGYVSSQDFYKLGKDVKAGDPRPNGGEYKSDGFRFMVKDLKPIRRRRV